MCEQPPVNRLSLSSCLMRRSSAEPCRATLSKRMARPKTQSRRALLLRVAGFPSQMKRESKRKRWKKAAGMRRSIQHSAEDGKKSEDRQSDWGRVETVRPAKLCLVLPAMTCAVPTAVIEKSRG